MTYSCLWTTKKKIEHLLLQYLWLTRFVLRLISTQRNRMLPIGHAYMMMRCHELLRPGRIKSQCASVGKVDGNATRSPAKSTGVNDEAVAASKEHHRVTRCLFDELSQAARPELHQAAINFKYRSITQLNDQCSSSAIAATGRIFFRT